MNSIFNRLLKLPDETMVFPAHDYKGDTVSTIGEERRYNPRLQVRSVDEYIELMANLKLPNPKMMDVAVPANMHVGLHQEDLAKQGLALSARDAIESLGRPDILLVDLRENSERLKHGTISGALHAPYPRSAKTCSPAACCAKSLPRPAAAWCSSAPSASARRWRLLPRRMRALPTPRISKAVSMRGRRWAGRWFTGEDRVVPANAGTHTPRRR